MVDTTVQEKDITFPTDNKLHRKIIDKCTKLAEQEGVVLRQSYSRTLKKLSVKQRHRCTSEQKKRARAADRKVRTIAGRLVRELELKLDHDHPAREKMNLFKKVLRQKRTDQHKIYSIHEPQTQCISKGKDHKKYEFGTKVSIMMTKTTGVIIGALNYRENLYHGHTLDEALKQQERLCGRKVAVAYADRGYRGRKEVNGTKICIPDNGVNKALSTYKRNKLRKDFCRRAAIEPSIGHLKSDYRLDRNFYGGTRGDDINVMLSAAAYNFKRAMRKAVDQLIYSYVERLYSFILSLLKLIPRIGRVWAF